MRITIALFTALLTSQAAFSLPLPSSHASFKVKSHKVKKHKGPKHRTS